MHYLFLAQLLIMIVGPLVKMVLRVIGFGFVSYVGFNLVIDQARSYMQSSMGQLAPNQRHSRPRELRHHRQHVLRGHRHITDCP